METPSAYRKHLLPLGALLLVAVVPYWRIALGLDHPAEGDILGQFYVWKTFWIKHIRNGDFPLWYPHAFCGSPHLANVQTGSLYPPEVLSLLTGPFLFFGWAILFHIWLAGLGVYGLVWDRTKNHWSAVFGATVFCHAGTTAMDGTYAVVRNLFPTAWTIMTIWFTWRTLARPTRRRFAATALSVAMTWLSGSPQFAIYAFYALLFFCVLNLAAKSCRDYTVREAARRLALVGAAFLLGSIIAGIQLVPMYELAGFSANRSGGASYEFATIDSYPPFMLPTVLCPRMFGLPEDRTWWTTTTGHHEICAYLGFPTLILVIVSAFVLPKRDKLIWLSVAGISLVAAFGKFTPVYKLFYYAVPGFSMFRVPARSLFLLTLSVSVLAGLGTSRLFGSRSEATSRSLMNATIIGIMLFGIALLATTVAKSRMVELFGAVGVRVVVGDAESQGRTLTGEELKIQRAMAETRFNVFRSSMQRPLVLGIGMLTFLLPQWKRSRGRIVTVLLGALVFVDFALFLKPFIKSDRAGELFKNRYDTPALAALLPIGGEHIKESRYVQLDDTVAWFARGRLPSLQPNRPQILGLSSVRGSDPVIIRHYAEFVSEMQGFPKSHFLGALLSFLWERIQPEQFRYLACRYILTTRTITNLPLLKDGEVKVYEYRDALPRAFIEDDEGRVAPVEFTCDSPDRVVLQGNTSTGRKLVLLDTWYPGWRAKVNGEVVPVEQWKAFRAVRVPRDKVEVEFTFQPLTVKIGLVLTIVGLCMLTAIVMVRRNDVVPKEPETIT